MESLIAILSKRDFLLRSFVALGNNETQLEIVIPELRNEVFGISNNNTIQTRFPITLLRRFRE
ncbi:hypothetical protein VCR4J2_30137 [Vibrio coralliirubri]|nr:hypothetical protein VCR4J2_30137 [Vibrio coralliirubri]